MAQAVQRRCSRVRAASAEMAAWHEAFVPRVQSAACRAIAVDGDGGGGGTGYHSAVREGCRTGWVTHRLADSSEINPYFFSKSVSGASVLGYDELCVFTTHAPCAAVRSLPRRVGTTACRVLQRERR